MERFFRSLKTKRHNRSHIMLTLTIGLSLALSLACQAEDRIILAMDNPSPLVESPNIVGSNTQQVSQRVIEDSTTVSEASEPFLTIQNNRVSAWLENRPLNWVMQEVVAQSHVSIIESDENAAVFETTPVTVRFESLPLDQGIQKLLKEVDAFYFYQSGEQETAVLQTVWVYPKGQGETMKLVSSTVLDPDPELYANLSHPDPAQRIKALKAIIKRDGSQAEPYILDALEDLDESVRLQALQGAFRTGIVLPVNLLGDLLQYDAYPRIRFLALHAISRDPETNRWLIDLATTDIDEKIQAQANVLLSSMVVDPEDDHTHEGDGGHH